MDLSKYPEAVASLLRRVPLAPLGPGTPDASARPELAALGERDVPAACRAGLWLAFNYLDESHEISQGLHTAEGSYWHAIMHRREPDADNSKYWFRRVGRHAIFGDLAKGAAGLGYGTGEGWDAFAFVDRCEEVRGTGGAAEETCRRVQRAEWELLFDWCFQQGTTRG